MANYYWQGGADQDLGNVANYLDGDDATPATSLPLAGDTVYDTGYESQPGTGSSPANWCLSSMALPGGCTFSGSVVTSVPASAWSIDGGTFTGPVEIQEGASIKDGAFLGPVQLDYGATVFGGDLSACPKISLDGGVTWLYPPAAMVAADDVRNGMPCYSGGPNGTCHVPAAASVAFGVAVDNTTGSAVLTPQNVADALKLAPTAGDPATGSAMAGLADKTGFKLACDGLDAVSTTPPAGPAGNFREMCIQLWRRFFKKAVLTAGQLQTYADDGATVVTTQAATSDGASQTQGAAS